MKILVVDDCQTTRRLLGIYLKAGGYEVVFAENGLDAFEKLANNTVNLIMTDLNMPFMDGIEFTRTLRADPAFSDVPILVVTTEGDPEERERAMSAGANGYIQKPVTADKVTENIRSILKQMFSSGGDSNA